MTAHNSIKKLFRLYVGKQFSENGRRVFGSWLSSEANDQEKEELLRQLWYDTEGEITNDTKEDWVLLQNKLHQSSLRKFYMRYISYAAVVTLFVLTVGATYYLASQQVIHKPVEMAEIFVPRGECKEIILPDQSKVWLNAGSTLIYAKDFQNLTSRSIYLNGEASFSVMKDVEKPFIVKTAKMDVEALGTVFTVQAYADESFTTATLERGKVRVDVVNGKEDGHILYPNDQLIYSHEDGSVKLLKVDINNLEKKRQGYLLFHASPLKEIFLTLEKKYGVRFQYNVSRLKNESYNLKFSPNETIEDVMFILQQLIGVDYKIINNDIIIK